MTILSQSKFQHPARGITVVLCLALLGEPMPTASIAGHADLLPSTARWPAAIQP